MDQDEQCDDDDDAVALVWGFIIEASHMTYLAPVYAVLQR